MNKDGFKYWFIFSTDTVQWLLANGMLSQYLKLCNYIHWIMFKHCQCWKKQLVEKKQQRNV